MTTPTPKRQKITDADRIEAFGIFLRRMKRWKARFLINFGCSQAFEAGWDAAIKAERKRHAK